VRQTPHHAGLRVLVVEDELLVALALEDMLLELGHEIIGPAARISAAHDLLDEQRPDCAILDVNVNGETTYALAQALTERNIPFMFVTGYQRSSLAEPFQNRPILQKPFRSDDLGEMLGDLC
jgi:CheY-like chemotaxis protein